MSIWKRDFSVIRWLMIGRQLLGVPSTSTSSDGPHGHHVISVHPSSHSNGTGLRWHLLEWLIISDRSCCCRVGGHSVLVALSFWTLSLGMVIQHFLTIVPQSEHRKCSVFWATAHVTKSIALLVRSSQTSKCSSAPFVQLIS